jgi:hypothetical protein
MGRFARTATIETKLEVIPCPGPPEAAFEALPVPYHGAEMPVFKAPWHISNIATKLAASLAGDVFT